MNSCYRHLALSVLALSLLAVPGFAQDAEDAEREASIEPGEHFTEVHDTRTFYRVSGEEGLPLLLIHGYPLSSELFREQHEELSDSFRVITPDLHGFGQSSASEEDGSIETYAEHMLALLDQMGIEEAVIGGHSMGGMVALAMYEQAPDRFRGMILISTTAAPAPIVGQHLWKGFAAQAEEEGIDSLVAPLIPEMLTGAHRMENEDLVEHMEGMIQRASPEGAIAGGRALAERPDQTDLLESIEVPVLILVGVEDTVTPFPLSREMNEKIPNATLLVIEEASHAAIIEQADFANTAIFRWAGEEVAE